MANNPQNRPVEEAIGKALTEFIITNNLTQAEVGRIIAQDQAVVSKTRKGIRPWARALACLYILTGNEAFAPKGENERHILASMKAIPPPTLTAYMEDGTIPGSDKKKPKKAVEKKPMPSGPNVSITDVIVSLSQILGVSLEQLYKLVAGALGEDAGQPKQLIASPWFDRILSGVSEVKGQTYRGMRFILTRVNFQRFTGSFTPDEINDTRLLIQELRRRFNIITQLHDGDLETKSRLAKALGQEINELYISIEASRRVTQSQAASMIGKLRNALTANGSGEEG